MKFSLMITLKYYMGNYNKCCKIYRFIITVLFYTKYRDNYIGNEFIKYSVNDFYVCMPGLAAFLFFARTSMLWRTKIAVKLWKLHQ